MKYNLSIDIDKDRITLLRAAPGDKDNLLSLECAVTYPVSSAHPEDEIPMTIKAILMEHNIREKEAVLIASVSARNNDAFLGRFYLPVMPLGEVRAAVIWEARSVMPFDPRGALFNYHIEGKVRDKYGVEKIAVSMGAIKIKEARRLLEIATKAGLIPIGLLHPFSAIALFLKESALSGTTILLDVGKTIGLLIYRNGQFEFERRIVPGEDELDRMLTEAGVELELSAVKSEYGLLSSQDLSQLSLSEPPEGAREIRAFVDELAIKTRRALKQWVEEQGEEVIEKIYLIGSLTQLRNLAPYLANKLNIDVTVGNAASMKVEMSLPEETSIPELSLLIPAIGGSSGRRAGIELLPPEAKLRRKLTQVGTGIRVSLALVFGSVLLMSIFTRINSIILSKTVDTMRTEVAILMGEEGDVALEGKKEELTRKLAHYYAVAGREQPIWAGVMREITNITSAGVLFREMRLDGDEGVLLINGIVLQLEENVFPERVLARFIEEIENSPFFIGASLLNIDNYVGPDAGGMPARSFSLSIIIRKLPPEVFR